MSQQSVRCHACGGTFDGGDEVCTFCRGGIRFAGLGLPGRETTLSCPRCGEDRPLYEIEYRGVHIDVCPRCEGSWYDLGEIEIMVRGARGDSKGGSFEPSRPSRPASSDEEEEDRPAAPVYIRCPHCDKVMGRRNWESRSGILIDWCPEHGVWLDGGELQRIRAWAARTPEGPPPPLDVNLTTKPAPSSVGAGLGGHVSPLGSRGESTVLLAEAGFSLVNFLGRLLFGR